MVNLPMTALFHFLAATRSINSYENTMQHSSV